VLGSVVFEKILYRKQLLRRHKIATVDSQGLAELDLRIEYHHFKAPTKTCIVTRHKIPKYVSGIFSKPLEASFFVDKPFA